MICWLVGAMPERVFVTASVHSKEIAELNDVDTAVIVLDFSSLTKNRPGPIAIIDISRHGVYGFARKYLQTFRFFVGMTNVLKS